MNLNGILTKLKSETVITALSASFLLSFTLAFFGPATLYYTNIFEYYYTFSDILPYLIGLTIIFGILLTFTSFLFKGKTHQKIICLIFAVGLLFYIQGNILVWDYGLLNGQEILWNNFFINGVVESLIWIAVIILSLIKSDKIYKFIPVVCFFLLVIQTGGLLALVHFAPDEPQWKSYSFVNDGSEFKFSKDTNVIIIVLDTFQSDVFQEIINENDDYKKMFTGFTYYRNTVGGYPTTMASIPLILTGKYYNNSVPFDTYTQTTYESSSLLKTLKENGYSVYITGSGCRLIYPNEDLESNVKKTSYSYQRILPQLTQLGKLTLFRHFPQFLKERLSPVLIEQGSNLETYSEGSNQNIYSYADRGFIQQFTGETIRFNDAPTFQYYHLNGAHPPFRVNELLEYEELPNNRSGYKEQSKASLQIVGNLLNKLKENGVFNNSIIIVVGDHGRQSNEYGLNYSQLNPENQISYVSSKIVTGGIPLMLVKPLNSTFSLAISDAPVSLSDIPKSVATELNLSNTFSGESVRRVQVSDTRNFTFYQYSWANEDWTQEYLPSMTEYTINNFSWFGSSWQPTYRVYTSKGIETNGPQYYTLGSTIKFGQDQQLLKFSSPGWGYPQDGYVWSDGKNATIAFSMNRSNTTLMNLQVTAFPFSLQRVTVFLNQHELGNYSFTDSQLKSMNFLILPNYLNEQEQYLSFFFPDAISPSELGISSDPRKLAIAITSFNITEVNGDRINIGGLMTP